MFLTLYELWRLFHMRGMGSTAQGGILALGAEERKGVLLKMFIKFLISVVGFFSSRIFVLFFLNNKF